jgi:hypothetical protein
LFTPPHLPSSHPFYWKSRHYHVKRRDYLSLITWTSHYDWSIKSTHFLWVQLSQLSTAFEQTLVSNLQISHNLITILHLKFLAQKFLLVCGGDCTLFYFYLSNFTLQWQKVWKIMDLFFVFSVHSGKKKATKWKKTLPNFQTTIFLKWNPSGDALSFEKYLVRTNIGCVSHSVDTSCICSSMFESRLGPFGFQCQIWFEIWVY